MPTKRKSIREKIQEFWSNDSEKLDPVPFEIPAQATRPLSLQDEIRRFIQTEVSQNAEDNEHETFEEADDFEEENPEVIDLTPYETALLTPFDDEPSIDPAEPDEKEPPARPTESPSGDPGPEPSGEPPEAPETPLPQQ